MHDCAHDSVSLAVFDDIVVIATTNFLDLFLLSVAVHVITGTTLRRVRTSHEEPAVDFLTLRDHESFSLFLDLIANLLDQLFEQKLLNKKVNDLLSQNVPRVLGTLRVLHVQ